MDDVKEAKQLRPPYLSYKTFINFLDRLRAQGVPARIDRSVVHSFSGAVQGQLFSALQFLGLMNDAAAPTEKLRRIAVSGEKDRGPILKEIIMSAYPFLFGEKNNLGTMTSKLLQEKFEEAGTIGETTRKSMKFFLMVAKDTGIELSKYLGKPPERSPRTSGPPKKQKDVQPPEQKKLTPKSGDDTPDRKAVIPEKFLEFFDQNWPEERKQKWLDVFNWLTEKAKK